MIARFVTTFAALTAFAATAAAVPGISPKQLAEARASGEIRLLIDVRTHQEFERGHIPGAINIPHFSIETKSVPPAGKVAIYADGLGRIDVVSVANEMTAKPGIEAVLVSGGLAAWESAGLPTTHRKGLSSAETPTISYQQLEQVQANGVVLADLRTRGPRRVAAANGSASPGLSDLRSAFPQARVVEPGPSRVAQSAGPGADAAGSGEADVADQLSAISPNDELIVLIDDGDGSAEKILRKLRASGNKRVVLLAGGETILERQGRPGLGRAGYGIGDTAPPLQNQPNTP